MKKALILLILSLHIGFLSGQNDFSFVFLPDLHLNQDSLVISKFEEVATQLNTLNPDFILLGGDMIYTAKSVNDKKATALFDLMDKEFKLLNMPLYFTMGNHETVGITKESGIDSSNPMWGKRMYEKRYNKRHYSFMYEGWKFFILDGIQIQEEKKNYTSGVDSAQMVWIRDELLKTDKDVPIVVAIHTPLINPHAMSSSKSRALSGNSETVLNLFKDYKLKMVLQGHNHMYMNLFINGIRYVSGGSTQYNTDPIHDGYLLVKISGDVEESKFIQLVE